MTYEGEKRTAQSGQGPSAKPVLFELEWQILFWLEREGPLLTTTSRIQGNLPPALCLYSFYDPQVNLGTDLETDT